MCVRRDLISDFVNEILVSLFFYEYKSARYTWYVCYALPVNYHKLCTVHSSFLSYSMCVHIFCLMCVVQESMGYKAGQGLGRAGTGITAPISQSSQMGRRGLGYSAGGLEKEDVKWEEEEVS